MKSDDPVPLAGDVIGNTAYSQRFVLKQLLNLANDTLKDETESKAFEENLCTLWDMTTEKDVALFLHQHNALNLIHFALPFGSTRIKEILFGIIGNMCCQKQIAADILKMDNLLRELFDSLKTDETTIIIQLLRLMTTCLCMAESDDLSVWMDLFIETEHSSVLYCYLECSADKELLTGALDHLNTICGYFNTDKYRAHFFNHFVKDKALQSLVTAFTEITQSHISDCEMHDLEMILVISLNIAINLVGFENSLVFYKDNIEDILTIINPTLNYYVNKLVDQKEIDTDLIDIVDTINAIVKMLKLSTTSEPEKFFNQSFKMWKTVCLLTESERNGSDFEEENVEEKHNLTLKLKASLGTLVCMYIAQCSEENLIKVSDSFGKYHEEMVMSLKDKELVTEVLKRVENYHTRLKETLHS
ncbi:uncharacterized protein LOC115445204 [Manduca sexta]|uniref:Protein SAAL1 n=1 Tax=Manduca sexta TaxID=7130 RepID=A0A921Z839_MANSE|nr:uncharacterized protein LOC115445204 [Manduca sexta]KAG6452843.1 hypothetical protein O3G_MSEX007773 [Manduca sexta]